jgi:hypothetical protein
MTDDEFEALIETGSPAALCEAYRLITGDVVTDIGRDGMWAVRTASGGVAVGRTKQAALTCLIRMAVTP